jgi:hypothetical protein
MLEFLQRGRRARARKLQLFACACCRRVWPLLADERSRRAVEAAERYMDDPAGWREFHAAESGARAAVAAASDRSPARRFAKARREARVGRAAATAAWWAVSGLRQVALVARETASVAEARGLAWVGPGRHWQCALLHDLFGPLPFRPVAVEPSWLTWNAGTVRRLAGPVYEERSLPEGTLDRVRLAVLADALEDAGCTNEELLAHLRSPPPHVRGCWPVDLLLGRE